MILAITFLYEKFKAVEESTGKVLDHIALSDVDRINQSAWMGKVLIGPSEKEGIVMVSN